MKFFIENFRVWWQKPADPTERDIHREVSMLELFYDLVYVAIIIQLTHLVAGHVSVESVGVYIAVFLMILWAWFIGSLYHELHGNVDLKTRIIIFLQMLCLIGIGVFIHNIFEDGYRPFAFFYGLFSMIHCFLLWRTGVHDEEHKEIITPFVRMFMVIVISFFVSVFTPKNISYLLWGMSIISTILYTVYFMMSHEEKHVNEKIMAIKNIGESFVERLSLIVTIILGEGVISLIEGGAHTHHWGVFEVLNVVGSFILLVLLWLLYFDFISRRLPKESDGAKAAWIGLHFPLIGSIGLVSAGLLNLLEYSEVFTIPDRLILMVPLIVFLLCYLGLLKTIQISEVFCPIFRNVYNEGWVALVVLIIIALSSASKATTLWMSNLCLFLLFASSFIIWIRLQVKRNKKK